MRLEDNSCSAVTQCGKHAMSDEIILAFHMACDLRDVEVARKLLIVLEVTIRGNERRSDFNWEYALNALLAGHERLWALKHEGDTGR